MPNLVTTLKSEISRLSRKELKGDVESLRKAAVQQRSETAKLRRQVSVLERRIRALEKGTSRTLSTSIEHREKNEPVKLRFRAQGFATLRKKLGLSANDMGRLVGVSGQSIYFWEAGKTAPRASQLPAIAAVRKLGKREALARLATLD